MWHPDGRLPGKGEKVGIFVWDDFSVGWTDSKNVLNQRFAKSYKAETQ